RTVDRVEDPEPAKDAEGDRRRPRQHDQEPEDLLAWEVGKHDLGQDIGQHDHDRLGREREEDRVAQRLGEDAIVEDRPEIPETDEVVPTIDARVTGGRCAEGIEYREHEREADKRDDIDDGGSQHQRPEHPLVVKGVTLFPWRLGHGWRGWPGRHETTCSGLGVNPGTDGAAGSDEVMIRGGSCWIASPLSLSKTRMSRRWTMTRADDPSGWLTSWFAASLATALMPLISP